MVELEMNINNKRHYDLRKFKERVKSGFLFGEFNESPEVGINLSKASHKIVGVEDNGETLSIYLEFLETPLGKQAKEIFERGELGFSLRSISNTIISIDCKSK